MASKTCPSCMEDVPVAAARCKHCFHDFNEEPTAKKSGLLGLMTLLAAMGLIGAATFWFTSTNQSQQAPTKLDGETRQIIITTVTKDGPHVTKVAYSEVARIEYVLKGEDFMHEVVAVTRGGERHLIEASKNKPLAGTAETYAGMIGKARGEDCPWDKVSNISVIGGD